MTRTTSSTPVTASRLAALRVTLALAAKAPYYAQLWGDAWRAVEELDDLASLPTIDRGVLARYGEDLLTSRTFPDQIGLTGGTTWREGDRIAMRQASAEEYAAFEALGERLAAGATGPYPITLEIVSQIHGAAFGRKPFTLRLPLERENHWAAIKQMLSTRHRYDGATEDVQVVAASVSHLRLLAGLIERDRLDMSQFGLRGVLSSADHLTTARRREIGTAFRGTVWNVYGLSEIAGSPTLECPACSYFHLAPAVIGEFLPIPSIRGGSRLAELCLTSLAPFQVRQPLIRYRTGDVVRLAAEDCPQLGEPGFVPVGRLSASLFRLSDRHTVLLPDAQVAELVEGRPELLTTPFDENRYFGLTDRPSRPRYRLEPGGTGTLVLSVVLKPDYRDDGTASQVSAALERGLRSILQECGATPIPGIEVRVAMASTDTTCSASSEG